MVLAGLIAAVALLGADAENLLANPGFERALVDRPAQWDVFVQPKPGALGRLDSVARSGKHSVMLHTPMPYEREPMNNWSQNVLRELGGKRLEASAYIRVEDVSEAALWVQCWRRRPWGVLAFYTSSTDAPIYGTRDWERVALTVDVPKQTDFVTVRCVLKGKGTAWFDDIVLREAGQREDENEHDEAEVGENAETGAGSEEAEPATHPVEEAPATGADSEETDRAVAAVEDEVARLRDANLLLADALQQVRYANTELMDELMTLREGLREVQQRIAKQPGLAVPETPVAPRATPLLVPHGVDWRTQDE